MVASLWAMMIEDLPLKRVRSASRMRRSVSGSTDAVASSSTMTAGSKATARAKESSCFCPTEKFDPRSRTLRVKAEIDNRDGRLLPGLFARADLGIAVREAVLLVPEEAVLLRSDGSVVFRCGEGNRVERVIVETGEHRGDRVEIAGGLAHGDQVVTRGQAGLVDGALVSPRNADGSPLSTAVSAAGGVAEPIP